MDISNDPASVQPAPLFNSARTRAYADLLPSSSPAFSTPIHPIRVSRSLELSRPSILPIILPPATLRPLAFRTFTKKHSLTLTSSALQIFAVFIGKHCGSGWREDGLAEKVLDEAAKSWKKSGGGVIVPGEGVELTSILRNIESSMTGRQSSKQRGPDRQGNFPFSTPDGDGTAPDPRPAALIREDRQASLGLSALGVDEDVDASGSKDPRRWLKIVGAFDQPRLTYNVSQKHFEIVVTASSLLPDPSHKTHLFRHRYNLIYQRLLRNESFQSSSVASARTGALQRSASTIATTRQSYKLTPIANLLGRTGSSHLLLGLLTISPTGVLTLNDLTGSIALDIQHARPVPEDGAWFTPGMIVLVDGVYEEGSSNGPGLDGDRGVGGTVGGKFIAYSVGGPPCERREITLGVNGTGIDGSMSTSGGFGWVDFLGVGSERAAGSAMRKLESSVLKRASPEGSAKNRARMVVCGDVELDTANTLQALKKLLALYAAEPADQTPMVIVLMGNFVHYAVMAGGGSGGSIEYKEYFDSLASTLSDYPTMLENTTFVFVPGDNDPWASAFSAGAATVLPRTAVPELFTSRVKRAFATVDAEKATSKRSDGEAIWSTNPTRLTLFGPAQEIVFFRDNISGRLRRNAMRFRLLEAETAPDRRAVDNLNLDIDSGAIRQGSDLHERTEVDLEVQTAESHIPISKAKEQANSLDSCDQHTARKLVKTILDQGYLSPFPPSERPVLWDHTGALQLYPLPSALVLMDPECPPFAVTYEGCHVMNPGPLTPQGRRNFAQWMEYDAITRKGRIREGCYFEVVHRSLLPPTFIKDYPSAYYTISTFSIIALFVLIFVLYCLKTSASETASRMSTRLGISRWLVGIPFLGALSTTVLANDILKTTGFTSCIDNSEISVTALNIKYDRSTQQITFDVAGSSAKEENVTASLYVSAYGRQVYQRDFNPCDDDSKVPQLCPVPAGLFAAQGVQDVPSSYANQIPSIAFNVPDLEGGAKLELTAAGSGQDLACIESDVTNGNTVEAPAVSYIAGGIAAAALLLTGFSALGSAGTAGGHAPSPNFGDVVGWFQSIAMNGMLSNQYPPIYRSFSKNFAFSGGLIPWTSMQTSIDNFRKATGGNLTNNNVQFLHNTTLVYGSGSSPNAGIVSKRAIDFSFEPPLTSRDTSTTINGTHSGNGTTSPSNGTDSSNSKVTHLVHGIQGYVEQLTIPQANTFMTVLLVFAIVIAAIAVGILLFKVVLETWALFGSFPKKLTNFRKRYWGLLARTITNLILLLYGVWTLYCVYQFTNGDSWAAKSLAGVTLGLFTAVLAFFTFRIWKIAQNFKKMEGDAAILFEDKETWRKYSLFYDNYKRGYWWLFMPAIVYMFAKGCVIAAGNGHGLAQTAGQLIIESLMLALVLFTRPFATTAGNWINVVIQVVRLLSVVCILVFVQQLGIAQSTKTITGLVLIAVQSVLTAVLAILIAVNAIIVCVKENPHRKQRKQAEKANRDFDDLTPLDARNSLLIDPIEYHEGKNSRVRSYPLSTYSSLRSYDAAQPYRDETPRPRRPRSAHESSENLVGSAASMGHRHNRSTSRESHGVSPPPEERQPTVPDMGYRGQAY